VPLFVFRLQSHRPSSERSGGLSCSTVVYGACHWDVEEHVLQREGEPGDSRGREEMWRVGVIGGRLRVQQSRATSPGWKEESGKVCASCSVC